MDGTEAQAPATKGPLALVKGAYVYQGQTLVLNNVSMQVNAGEFVYLIGKTGSGKSSLLKTLYGDLSLDQGTGECVGYKLERLKKKEVPFLRRKLGIVFQDFQLLTDRSVAENLIFVMKATGWKDAKKMQQKVDEVLSLVGIQTKGFRMPHELSGGEQQRVVIARALLNDPELILADEPTGNLDPDTSDDIMQLLRRINRETHTAILMATHNYLLIEKFPARIIRCANGNVTDEENILVQ